MDFKNFGINHQEALKNDEVQVKIEKRNESYNIRTMNEYRRFELEIHIFQSLQFFIRLFHLRRYMDTEIKSSFLGGSISLLRRISVMSSGSDSTHKDSLIGLSIAPTVSSRMRKSMRFSKKLIVFRETQVSRRMTRKQILGFGGISSYERHDSLTRLCSFSV